MLQITECHRSCASHLSPLDPSPLLAIPMCMFSVQLPGQRVWLKSIWSMHDAPEDACSSAACAAGLVFFNLGNGATDTFQRLGVEFFVLLLFELLPFCYMSFYVADRKFYSADVASKLYHPLAYYIATMSAGKLLAGMRMYTA